jgi:AraC-like DNA-binding protein
MNQLVNGEIALDHLVRAVDVRIAEERIAAVSTDAEIVAGVSSFLRTAVGRSRSSAHPIVAATVAKILAGHESPRIEQLARDASISRRQLERLFQAQVGTSPKGFAVVARFAWAAARLRQGMPLSQLAAGAGYADQAHFIRAITRFSGSPPTRLLAAVERGIVSQSFNT